MFRDSSVLLSLLSLSVRHPGALLRVRVSPAHALGGRPRPLARPGAPGPGEPPPRQAPLPQG